MNAQIAAPKTNRRPRPRPRPAQAPAAPARKRRSGPAQRAMAPVRKAPAPAAPAPSAPSAFVSRSPELEFDSIASTSMFNTLGRVRALPAEEACQAVLCRTIAEARGYEEEDLFALAEVGYHYIRNGGYKLAEVIFQGLTEIAPSEVYFALALGLTQDYLGKKEGARLHYGRALKLDPRDPRPELNLAELDLEAGNKSRAIERLRRAERKATRSGQDALQRKAQALLELLTGKKMLSAGPV